MDSIFKLTTDLKYVSSIIESETTDTTDKDKQKTSTVLYLPFILGGLVIYKLMF